MDEGAAVAPLPDFSDLEALPQPVVAAANDYPAGHKIPPHSHRRAQLIYARLGVMTVTTDTGAFVVPTQRAVWMPAGTVHAVTSRTAFAMRTLLIRSEAVPELPGACCVVNVSPLLRELILQIVDLPETYDADSAEARLTMVALDQIRTLNVAPLHLPIPNDARLRRVTDPLRDDPSDPRDLSAWAKSAGVGERTLARLFQSETNMSFRTWRQQVRMLHALALLAEGQSVTHVALDVGYDSPSAFTAMFRRTLGVSPSQYFGTADPLI